MAYQVLSPIELEARKWPLTIREIKGLVRIGNTAGRKRVVGCAIGEILDDLLTSKGWTTRTLEAITRFDEHKGRVAHQHISEFIRGTTVPSEFTLSRLLKPFGYRAVREIKIEPIPKEEEGE